MLLIINIEEHIQHNTAQLYTNTNMLAFTRIAASRTTSLVLPKAAAASGISSRFFAGIGDDLAHKVREY